MKIAISFLSFIFAVSSCSGASNGETVLKDEGRNERVQSEAEAQHVPVDGQNIQKVKTNSVAYFASGCFWCVEAVFESVIGVGDVVSGYSGGNASDAKYDLVSAGQTNHAEAVAVYYDSTKVDYPTLLKVFFGSHDPTTLNQQGPDRGAQYRSSIFYRNTKEKVLAQKYVQELLKKGTFSKITTEIVPLKEFYPAENYHQNYEHKNPNNPYVKSVSVPRLNRFKQKFPELLK